MSALRETIAPIATSVAALAAWVSAWNSRQAAARAQRPFVYGEPALRSHGGGREVEVRLRNDGPGVALGVRARLEASDGSWAGDALPSVRAMRPGDVVPPPATSTEYGLEGPPRDVRAWALVTRFADAGGQQWEVRNQRHPLGPLTLKRVRSRRLDPRLWRPRRDW